MSISATRFMATGSDTQMPVAGIATQNTSGLLNNPANTFITASDNLINLQNSASKVVSDVASATPPLAMTGAMTEANAALEATKAKGNGIK